MSYYKGEEVTYIGSIIGNGSGIALNDTSCLIVSQTGSDRYNPQYVGTFSVNKGDILYFKDEVDFPAGGYFKAKITYTFSTSYYSSDASAMSDLHLQIFCETADCVLCGSESVIFEYLGDDFSLSELSDELPTEAPTESSSVTVPSSGNTLTYYDYSGCTLATAESIINGSGNWLNTILSSVLPISLVAFGIGFGIKKALSFFKTIAGGGKRE